MERDLEPGHRDVVVIGASAGGLEAVRRLVAALPGDLPAALFVVIHRGDSSPSLLAEILDAAGRLPAVAARRDERFEQGRIYVAPPDHHLLVGHDHLHARRGPRENRARPAVDPLFRSAAVSCSSRAIGVLLSGMLDDGTAGLLAIRRCGGTTLVQDPCEAQFGDMPRSAIAHGAADHVVSVDAMAGLLDELTHGPCPPPVDAPDRLRIEALIAAQELVMDPDHNRLGRLSPLTCPECHGVLYEIDEDGFLRFRCHTGHGFTAKSLCEAQREAWEQALYNALRTQEEQMVLARRLASEARERRRLRSAEEFDGRARGYAEGAEIIRRLLGNGEDGLAAAGEPGLEEAVQDPLA
jgi:two-component system chemotaxis response regulator CheB